VVVNRSDEAARAPRIFLLSPANVGGARGQLLLSSRAGFPLARALREEGAAIGDVFSFVSGLYFRGKLAYARRFATPPDLDDSIVAGGVLVITPNAGLRSVDTHVTLEAVRRFADVEVAPENRDYREPLVASARVLADAIGPFCDVVLLGSIASPRYLDLLLEVFDERLAFPAEFVGRGDMSRGALMLNCAAEGRELTYVRAGVTGRNRTRA
jgi:hypothetical protein